MFIAFSLSENLGLDTLVIIIPAAGSGTASTAMAVPVFSQKNHSKTIALNTQKRHRYTFIVQYDIIITTFPHNRMARICSDIAAVSVLVVCI